MAKIVMIKTSKGTVNESGSITRTYEAGEELETKEDWQKTLAQSFVEQGLAEEAGGNQKVPETKASKAKQDKSPKAT